MLTLLSSGRLDPHAWTRQPSGTWMKAPLSAPPLRNMWIVLAWLLVLLLLLPLVGADGEDGSKVVHSHCVLSHTLECQL